MPTLQVRYNGADYTVALRAGDVLRSVFTQLGIDPDPELALEVAGGEGVPLQPDAQLPDGDVPLVLRKRTAGYLVRHGTQVQEVHVIPAGGYATIEELIAAATVQLDVEAEGPFMLSVVDRADGLGAKPKVLPIDAAVPDLVEPAELVPGHPGDALLGRP